MVPRGRLSQITSRANSRYKNIRGLKPGFDGDWILVEGAKLYTEALRAGLTPDSVWSDKELTLEGDPSQVIVPSAMYGPLSPTKNGRPPLAVFPAPALSVAEEVTAGRWLLLDHVQEPGNAGALVRAAAAFGFDGLLWLGGVYPYHHACIRASAGSVFHLQHRRIQADADFKVPLIGTAVTRAKPIDSYDFPRDFVLVMGNEGQGMSEGIAGRTDILLHIPVSDRVESLNVAGAAHILMYRAGLS